VGVGLGGCSGVCVKFGGGSCGCCGVRMCSGDLDGSVIGWLYFILAHRSPACDRLNPWT
jgi:hypothetical protein